MADYVSAIQNGETLGTPSSVNVIVKGKNETWDIKNDHVELLQATGVKDAYGEEIYEGDVVHGYDQEPDIDDGYDGSSMVETVNFRWGSFWLGDFKNQIMLYTPPIIEVIGNVHTDGDLIDS